MKRKIFTIIFIAIYTIIGSFFELWAQEIKYDDDDIHDILNKIGFDINGEVTDMEGVPLDNIHIHIDFTRPDPNKFGESETIIEYMDINSKFHIQKTGYSYISLAFLKEGYYTEILDYSQDIFDIDKSNPILKKNIQVKMMKKRPRAKTARFRRLIEYNFEKGTKSICDLSAFSKDKKDNNKKEKEYEIKLKTYNSKTKNHKKKYIELDFKRDKKGKIVYGNPPSLYRDSPCPSTFIIRFHSDDPDDGIILMEDLYSKVITQNDFEKAYATAPEKGYNKKEIEIELKKNPSDGHYTFESKIFHFYIKCGNHFGKALITPIMVLNRMTTVSTIRTELDIVVNTVEGDKNLMTLLY